MNEQLDRISQGANFIESFLRDHPIVAALLLAAAISWSLTAAIKPWVADGKNKKRNLRTFDVVVAAIVGAVMLWGHVDWRLNVGLSLFIGGGSPFGYFMFTEALCWKWPSLRRYLSLRELAPEPDSVGDESSADADPPVPPDSKNN
jgi:hypothetical protein